MACSAVTLSLSTILSVLAVAAISISFSTDNWSEIRIDRNKTADRLYGQTSGLPIAFETDLLYFSRDEGLFRTCFPYAKPKGLETYTSPTQTQCISIDYHLTAGEEAGFSEHRWERLHMARSVIALFLLSLLFLFLSFFTGIAGCWKRSYCNLIFTGILQLLSALMVAGGMGLWHAVQFYDHHKLKDPPSYATWPEVLKENKITEFVYGWSYILGWIGDGLALIASILFLWAAICIRHEKNAEQTKNMQYLMPVYPDKRNPYGYAYAYPGPYAYYHGNQYGAGPYSS